MSKISMNNDIKQFPIYQLTPYGALVPIDWIKSVEDYNHLVFHLHHYIAKDHYRKNTQWYKERGIEQKLILVTIPLHEQIHSIATRTLSDEEFKQRYKISKWDLIFNRRYSNY